ncbi:FAD-dependent oxidoreductase [Rhodovulum sp. NI22]|nr:FAD-dependent oxidoreductase [Rhodovulum sp. NI22]
MRTDQPAELEWKEGGTPVSRRFDDPYFSLENGLEETRHVFLAGNDLPARFAPGFHIAELGFGTGLNMLAALIAWRHSGQKGALRFTSFEAFPMRPDDISRALDAFPEAKAMAGPFLAAWAAGQRVIETGDLRAEIIIGDARVTVPRWGGRADAWFLDGFSPARNPELWDTELMGAVARNTAPGGTLATYTAAGHVRRALGAAGFEVERRSGFGRKRHMTVGRMPA